MRQGDSATPPAALPGGAGYRFAVIVSRFNQAITGALRDGARAALAEAGVAAQDAEEIEVPGAFELPQAARCAAETGRFDAIVCLGCVIRGETPHFEYISAAVAQGIMDAEIRRLCWATPRRSAAEPRDCVRVARRTKRDSSPRIAHRNPGSLRPLHITLREEVYAQARPRRRAGH